MRSDPLSRSKKIFGLSKTRLLFKATLTIIILSPLAFNATQGYLDSQSFNKNMITVVAVQGGTTVFQNDRFTHGFAYDLARNYVTDMNMEFNLVTVKDDKTALKWVKKGKADFALTTTSPQNIEQSKLIAVEGSCGAQSVLQKYGLDKNLSWVFKSAEDPLAMTATGYLCQTKQTGQLQKLASFYDQNYLKPRDLTLVTQNLQQRLPIYKANFQKSADQVDMDWQFLAAIGYQESYLDPNSISPTGVRGVMMLTKNTAKAMGVADRTNPAQSIQGGAKYMDLMLNEYKQVPYPDRNWYALVAYNMGPGAVNGIRKQLEKQGKNPDQWINLYQHLDNTQRANPRHAQAIQYVKRIRVYLEHIKTTPLAQI